MNLNKEKFIEYLDINNESESNSTKLYCFNDDLFINDLISKPLEKNDAQNDAEKIKLFEDIFTPKKFKKSLSSEQVNSVRKPSPKKFKKSLTFSSPSNTHKTLPFYFKNNIEDEKQQISSINFESTSKEIEKNDSSETICISDEEINYSSIYSTPKTSKKSPDIVNEIIENPVDLNTPKLIHKRITELSKTLPRKIDENCSSTPDNVVIKTRNITPMPNYDRMNTPTIAGELEKVGVKNLKRHRGVQILKHIYYTTHPVVENGSGQNDDSDDGDYRSVKRRKSECDFNNVVNEDLTVLSQNGLDKKCDGVECNEGDGEIEIVGDIPESNELIFERKPSKKIYSCALPLHIAWFNFLTSNPEIKENVLLYVPLQLEVLYEMMKQEGFKYHIQDLLTFLDKKCITIRTNPQGGQKQHPRKNKD
nr:uncharacterized protein LOC111417234 [Onthophagus taurus]XP_022905222.1 uncharacterized protein LOC111417234 [Onthophagus taurus]XP_022905223.1 uncharacterized protein LOC111417234 [Onthophagus taurus]